MPFHPEFKDRLARYGLIAGTIIIGLFVVSLAAGHRPYEMPMAALSDIKLEQHLCRELLYHARTSTDTLMVLQQPVRLAEPCLLTLKVDTTAEALQPK